MTGEFLMKVGDTGTKFINLLSAEIVEIPALEKVELVFCAVEFPRTHESEE